MILDSPKGKLHIEIDSDQKRPCRDLRISKRATKVVSRTKKVGITTTTHPPLCFTPITSRAVAGGGGEARAMAYGSRWQHTWRVLILLLHHHHHHHSFFTPIPTLGDDKTWSPAPLLFHSILPPSSQEVVEGYGRRILLLPMMMTIGCGTKRRSIGTVWKEKSGGGGGSGSGGRG